MAPQVGHQSTTGPCFVFEEAIAYYEAAAGDTNAVGRTMAE